MQYTKHSSDRDLIEGCRQHRRLAQQHLYQRYYGKMMAIALRYSSNQQEAMDILNRAFLKVFQSLDRYEAQGSLSGWMAKIVFHTAIDLVRSQAVYRQRMDFETDKDIEFAPEILDQLAAADLYAAIQQLPMELRSVLSLFVLDGYKHREIAELLDISVNTSKWHLATAKRQLRQLLKNYDQTRLAV